MRTTLIAVLFTTTSIGASASPKPVRRAVVFGGNCDAQSRRPSENMFRQTMTNLAKGLKRHGWQVTALYDGDEARCTKLYTVLECSVSTKEDRDAACCPKHVDPSGFSGEKLAAAAGLDSSNALKRASKEELFASLDAAISDAEKGALPAGSEFLLSVSTHGSEKTKDQAHGWCISDRETMPVDDPEFITRLNALKQKGVKIAVLDSSCHGGASIPVLSPYGCVLTSQSSNAVAWGGGVNDALATLMNSSTDELRTLDVGDGRELTKGDGKITLDEVYLRSLFDENNLNMPGISGVESSHDKNPITASGASHGPAQLTEINIALFDDVCRVDEFTRQILDLSKYTFFIGISSESQMMLKRYSDALQDAHARSIESPFFLSATLQARKSKLLALIRKFHDKARLEQRLLLELDETENPIEFKDFESALGTFSLDKLVDSCVKSGLFTKITRNRQIALSRKATDLIGPRKTRPNYILVADEIVRHSTIYSADKTAAMARALEKIDDLTVERLYEAEGEKIDQLKRVTRDSLLLSSAIKAEAKGLRNQTNKANFLRYLSARESGTNKGNEACSSFRLIEVKR